MVDFENLRGKKTRIAPTDPLEIFRRMPKPSGINDLYTSQAEVLGEWFARRDQQDTVLKLHTGGGKTLVGLLIAQSSINEIGEGALYLVPTVQLVSQTIDKARELGINAVAYEKAQPLNDEFANGHAVMVATYKALFNGRSRFGLRGSQSPCTVSALILDDAHAAFPVIRDSFTLEARRATDQTLYEELTGLFRGAFKDCDRLGTFDDVVSGADFSVLEIPYWSWQEKIDGVRELFKPYAEHFGLEWPLVRDHLRLCHGLISRHSFSITPVLPLVSLFPTFSEAPRRIYMSATIADDSEIIRTFDADPESVTNPLTSRSLAGISERMMLIPELMPFDFAVRDAVEKLLAWTAKNHFGAVVLVPSDRAASDWSGAAKVAQGSDQVEAFVAALQSGGFSGPVVFANRYDGIDLPGDSCRLLVLSGLPTGSSSYELYRGSVLYGGATVTRMLAQRIEQGSGRGSRGSGDHCVVILMGGDLAAWIAKEANFRFLTSATRAQLEMGAQLSREVRDVKELASTIDRSFRRNREWTEYHAEMLADLVADDVADEPRLVQAAAERKAFDLWCDGYFENAIGKIVDTLSGKVRTDVQTRGWMYQLAARIAHDWGYTERAEEFQRHAFGENNNLLRPRVRPPYVPLQNPGEQETAIAGKVAEYRFRRGLVQSFNESVANLHGAASANQFEQALMDLAGYLGLASERHDINGEGPDVLWLLPDKAGLVIEAKSRKTDKPLTKQEHGQLLVAAEWFRSNYPEHTCVKVSVHPNNRCTRAAGASTSYALTPDNLARLVDDCRALLLILSSCPGSEAEVAAECAKLLGGSTLRSDRITDEYLVHFVETDATS